MIGILHKRQFHPNLSDSWNALSGFLPFVFWGFDSGSFSCPPKLLPYSLSALCISYTVLWVSKRTDRQPCPRLFFISFFSDLSISDLFSVHASVFQSSRCLGALPTEILTHWSTALKSSGFYCDPVFIEEQKIAHIFFPQSPALPYTPGGTSLSRFTLLFLIKSSNVYLMSGHSLTALRFSSCLYFCLKSPPGEGGLSLL